MGDSLAGDAPPRWEEWEEGDGECVEFGSLNPTVLTVAKRIGGQSEIRSGVRLEIKDWGASDIW